jgi:aspartate carbamoyltransferase catalytic subunit
MASIDSDQRYHPNPEILVPINGDFAGKDIVSISQFDQKSLDLLFSTAHQMEMRLVSKQIPPLLHGVVIISVGNVNFDRNRFCFESAALRLGTPSSLYIETPSSDDPYFDYRVLDIKAASPDIILISEQSGEMILRVAKALRSVEKVTPIINKSVIEKVNHADDPRWLHYDEETNGLPVSMALLALVLGKIEEKIR